MPLRLVEITLPSDQAPELREELATFPAGATCDESVHDGQVRARLLLEREETGPIIDAIDHRFGQCSGFQLLVLEVEAALPRREEPAKDGDQAPDAETGAAAATAPDAAPEAEPQAPGRIAGVSREELYHHVRDHTKLSRVYLVTVVLSTVVAAIGLLRDNVAVIIGAMVIAPLLGPNVALAFATTLGDTTLIRRSIGTNVAGVLLALALTTILGAFYTGNIETVEILARTSPSPSDIVLALAAGGAGALAMTSGVSAALTGVMVAVALLPPTVVAGLMLGAGDWSRASGAALLLAANVISVNLAGVLVFILQGVNPASWWEKDRARRSARLAAVIWVVLLAILGVLLVMTS